MSSNPNFMNTFLRMYKEKLFFLKNQSEKEIQAGMSLNFYF